MVGALKSEGPTEQHKQFIDKNPELLSKFITMRRHAIIDPTKLPITVVLAPG